MFNMDAKDLRIGNYAFSVMAGNIRVDEILSRPWIVRMYLNKGYDYDSWYDLPVSNVEPIPNIGSVGLKMKANTCTGTMSLANTCYDAPTDWGNVSESAESWGRSTGYCHGSAVIRTLYLHDLQNKFFAITGKDLEINLA